MVALFNSKFSSEMLFNVVTKKLRVSSNLWPAYVTEIAHVI
jgi:hypothetical protein